MATKQDLYDTQHSQDAGRDHSAPVFYVDPATKKPINTGLKDAALADWNSRLVVGKEAVNDGTRLQTKPL